MPPVMGVAAFVMSEMIGVPYLKIAAAAALPAVLYYSCLMISVHLEARRLGLKGLDRSRLPKFGNTLINAAPLAVPLLSAHLFVFYFGIIADITPPVALAAYAAAGIARADPMKAGLTATRLAISAYLIPFIFALNPALLLVDAQPLDIAEVIPSALIGIVGLSASAMGFWNREIPMWQRAILFARALGLLTPGILTDLAGLAALVLVWFLQRRRGAEPAAAGAPVAGSEAPLNDPSSGG